MSKPALWIRFNNAAINDPCALCGQHTQPMIGPELFLAGGMALVCSACGDRLAPRLMAALFEEQRRCGVDLIGYIARLERTESSRLEILDPLGRP